MSLCCSLIWHILYFLCLKLPPCDLEKLCIPQTNSNGPSSRWLSLTLKESCSLRDRVPCPAQLEGTVTGSSRVTRIGLSAGSLGTTGRGGAVLPLTHLLMLTGMRSFVHSFINSFSRYVLGISGSRTYTWDTSHISIKSTCCQP